MPDASAESLLDDLRQEVDSYVKELFDDHAPVHRADEGKAIRDPIHGFIYLSPLEVEVLDSPLLQRLRYVHQNALAYLVYPSARHFRFEHCLGMVKVIEDVASAIQFNQGPDPFDDNTKAELRLAALLHDVGHGLFSHLSETIIQTKWFEKFAIIKSHPEVLGKSPGEVLSYLLVTSRPFREFLEEASVRHHKGISVQRVAQYIVGQVPDPALDAYKADLITGPLDCDKLDYLARDAYFTGIRLEVDVQHIIRNLRVWEGPGDLGRILVIRLSGASFVEQMHFARLLMYPAMYHHQKVRALASEIRAIFELIWDDPAAIADPSLKFEHVTDFLRISDVEILTSIGKEPALQARGKSLLRRAVFTRALHIASSTVKKPLRDTDYFDLVKLGSVEPEAQAELRRIREEIIQAATIQGTRDASLLELRV